MRRLLLLLALAAAAALGLGAVRRSSARRAAHLDLYYDDGSMVSLEEASSEAARLLPLAHDVLRAARP